MPHLQVLEGHQGAEDGTRSQAVVFPLSDHIGFGSAAAHQVHQGTVESQDGGARVDIVLIVITSWHRVLDGNGALGFGTETLSRDALGHLAVREGEDQRGVQGVV